MLKGDLKFTNGEQTSMRSVVEVGTKIVNNANLRMIKKSIFTLALCAISLGYIYCQETSVAFHIYNPIGFVQKAGAKIEYRTNQMGFLLCAIRYYGSVPIYPGNQFGFEWRRYSIPKESSRSENFFYAKAIAGRQEHVNSQGSGFMSVGEIPAGNYYGVGAGVGKHISFKHFFIDLNGGLKYVSSTVKQESTFYISGPASFLDLHFNIGFQF